MSRFLSSLFRIIRKNTGKNGHLLQNKPSRLYNIPAQINSDIVFLQCGQTLTSDGKGGAKQRDYELYGVCVGYNENSSLPNRSVEQLAMLAGREYRLLYPQEGTEGTGHTTYTVGFTGYLPRVLFVEDTSPACQDLLAGV